MLDKVRGLEARVVVLEGLVEVLLGKAIADSGTTVRVLEDMQAENESLPDGHGDDPITVALHQRIVKALSDRTIQGHKRSLRFPRQWTRKPRRRD